MDDSTLDAAGKLRVKQALLADAQAGLDELLAQVGAERAAAAPVEDEVTSADDVSQAEEAGDLGGLFERSVARHRAALQQIEALDFAPTQTVGPGAVVGFDGARFVVGVVSEEFECDGSSYEGISEDSPLYAHIQGLRAGDEFAFGDQTHRIDLVV